MATRYAYTNLIARDWRRLVAFYESVFECVAVPPERDLSGVYWSSDIGRPGQARLSSHEDARKRVLRPSWGANPFSAFVSLIPK